MTGHTPGPWALNDHTVYGGPDEQSIAELCNRSHPSMTANGRLIAGAPALLKEAKALIAWLQGESGTETSQELVMRILRLQVAITEAEGRS